MSNIFDEVGQITILKIAEHLITQRTQAAEAQVVIEMLSNKVSALEIPSDSTTLRVVGSILLESGAYSAVIGVNATTGALEIVTSAGTPTVFAVLPECAAVPSTNDQLVNKAYVDQLVQALEQRVAALEAQQP